MIEKEIQEILGNPLGDGSGLNELADEFRRGRDTMDIIRLLDSKDPDLIWPGAWILKEIPIEFYNTARFLSRLKSLVFHESFDVRFSAFGALFPLLNPDDQETHDLLQKMTLDPREDVRDASDRARKRLFVQKQ